MKPKNTGYVSMNWHLDEEEPKESIRQLFVILDKLGFGEHEIKKDEKFDYQTLKLHVPVTDKEHIEVTLFD